jgi:16S rRNA (uracil1498-N3)-methyltransferase
VRVFDGAGQEFEAILELVTRRAVIARAGREIEARAESPLHVVLAASALRGDRMELVIQKAVELGVAQIWPVVSARTDAAARPALRGARDERWAKVASGAAEQCGRAVVPELRETVTLTVLLERGFEGLRVLLLETPGAPPLRSLPPPAGRLLLLVGPPGGWETQEVAALEQAGFRAVSLGPRVLRAETAAVAGIAVAQALWGDLS